MTVSPRTASGDDSEASGSRAERRSTSASGVMRDRPRALRCGSRPLERAFAPYVDEAKRQHEDEHQHLDEAEQPERAEHHGPRVEEDDLDVEDDEQDGGEIEFDRETAPRRTARRVP